MNSYYYYEYQENIHLGLKCYGTYLTDYNELFLLLWIPGEYSSDDKPLVNVEHFEYLGSTISHDGSLDREIDNRIKRWAVPAIQCSANTTSPYLRNWRSTMLWFFHPSSVVVRRGHCIAGISRNWSSSTCKLSTPSWESGGRTTSPIWRSSIKLSPPAQRPPSSRPNFNGLDMWFEWRSVGCWDAWCTGNSRLAKETKVDQNCGIKTWSKPISSGATSIRETWRDMPWTDQNGKAQFIELLPTSKRLDARNSLLPERDTAEQLQQWSQQLTSSAPTVQDSVPLGWGCGATSMFIDEL